MKKSARGVKKGKGAKKSISIDENVQTMNPIEEYEDPKEVMHKCNLFR